jgi:hypothetical protein
MNANANMSAPTLSPASDCIVGLVERVTFHNSDNGFCALRLLGKGERELVTLVRPGQIVLTAARGHTLQRRCFCWTRLAGW